MSLLRQRMPYGQPQDDYDGFPDDYDDDDLSFDGIYDDERPAWESSAADVDSLPLLLSRLTIVPRGGVPNRKPRPQQRRYPGIDVCIVCQERPPCSNNGKTYPTCGLTCAGVLKKALDHNHSTPPRGSPARMTGRKPSTVSFANTPGPSAVRARPVSYASSSSTTHSSRVRNLCVVCRQRPCRGAYVTCGLKCVEKLCTSGSADPTMCNYCHRRPKLSGHDQCGKTCADAAKEACLLCKSRPKYKRYHLCGKICKQISTKKTPLLLEVPKDHATWDHVQKKFETAWKGGTIPTIKNIYKVIESKNFLQPYDQYKKRIGKGTEAFRYHGTSRRCTLGINGNKMLCNDSGCALCSILKTSFKTSLANPNGRFGAGIYSSSAANMAYAFSGSGNGGVILTKAILGKVHDVATSGAVKSCPAGSNSVVWDSQGPSNETIVYSDDAIRPVFLLSFK